MAVTADDLARAAELARLRLEDERVPELVRQLNGILTHMRVLGAVDTEGVPPAAGVGDAGLPLREDHGPPVPLERPLEALAPRGPDGRPAMRDGFFLVPRLATHAEAPEALE